MTPQITWPGDVRGVLCQVRLQGEPGPVGWSPDLGPLPLHRLVSFRAPSSHDRSRHVPVRAFSRCTRTTVRLESGLEYQLFRVLDRAPQTARIISQPLQLRWREGSARRSHVPDLLVIDRDGAVRMWDARPLQRRDERFARSADVSRVLATLAGWSYETFAGLEDQNRLNLVWLHCYRRDRPWHAERAAEVKDVLHEQDGTTTLGDLWGADDGSGELIETVWHLIYCGVLRVEESRPMVATSTVLDASGGAP